MRALWITLFLGSILIFLCSWVLSGFNLETTWLLIRDTFTTVNANSRNLTQGFLTLTLAPIGVYWSLDTIFGRRWTYCAGLYNELVKMRAAATPKDPDEDYLFHRKEDYMEALIAYDLIDLDLYYHKSFHEFFANTLEKALKEQGVVLNSFIVDLRCEKIGSPYVRELMSAYLFKCQSNLDRRRTKYGIIQRESAERKSAPPAVRQTKTAAYWANRRAQ
ncbi:hypothetical protein ACES2I_13100 [Bdellovibrio bacteriovorus]|uniref:hypothetical protein n=1 Tax=Bdellovibrio bacteriovorus TaxID=959 RepID=UPI0035A61BDB